MNEKDYKTQYMVMMVGKTPKLTYSVGAASNDLSYALVKWQYFEYFEDT